ncbi:hypothetical protein RYX36_007960 [Vicia faba]
MLQCRKLNLPLQKSATKPPEAVNHGDGESVATVQNIEIEVEGPCIDNVEVECLGNVADEDKNNHSDMQNDTEVNESNAVVKYSQNFIFHPFEASGSPQSAFVDETHDLFANNNNEVFLQKFWGNLVDMHEQPEGTFANVVES